MSSIGITVSHRPVRMGWCVRHGDFAQLRTALRLTTMLWGGRFNPIIPVDDPTFANQLTELFHVDALYGVASDPVIESFIEPRKHVSWPRFIGPLLLTAFDAMKDTASTTLLDTGFAMARLAEKRATEEQNTIGVSSLPKWTADDPLAIGLMATFGEFPDDAWGEPLEWRFTSLRGKDRRTLGSTESLPPNMLRQLSPLDLTMWGLYPLRGGLLQEGGLFVGDGSNYDELIEFWNLNAAGNDLWFYDPSQSQRQEELLNAYLAAVEQRIEKLPETSWNRYLHIWSSKVDSLPDLPTKLPVMRQTLSRSLWNGLNVKPPLMTTLGHGVIGAIAKEHDKPTLTFQPQLDKEFDVEEAKGQHFVMTVRPHHTGLEPEGFTFAAPNIPELNEYYGREIAFEPDHFRIGPDGLGIITRAEKTYYTLFALPIGDLFERIFDAFGMHARPSRAGLIAKRLIRQMGGLQRCRVFKIAGVRDLIESFGPTQSFTRGQALQKIRPGFSNYEQLYITARETPVLKPDDAFNFLLDNGVFRAGLEFKCPNCELDFWLLLDDAKTWVGCEYCGARFNATTQLKYKNGWKYRRSGLFGRDNHQEGGIPVSLALQRLDTSADRTMDTSLYTTALKIRPVNALVPECEIDFAFLSHLPDGRVELSIGEAKGGDEIEERDVANLKAIAAAFPRERLKVYPTFAKAGEFSLPEIERCLAATDVGAQKHILFSKHELEPYDLHQRFAGLPHRLQYESSLSALAEATAQLYQQEVPTNLGSTSSIEAGTPRPVEQFSELSPPPVA